MGSNASAETANVATPGEHATEDFGDSVVKLSNAEAEGGGSGSKNDWSNDWNSKKKDGDNNDWNSSKKNDWGGAKSDWKRDIEEYVNQNQMEDGSNASGEKSNVSDHCDSGEHATEVKKKPIFDGFLFNCGRMVTV